MNRIRHWSERTMLPSMSTSRVDSSMPQPIRQRELAYSLFVPHHYEPNYAYPLMIWLHGPGDDESQLCGVIPHISTQNYVGVAPRGCCPAESDNDADFWNQEESAIETAERRIFAALDVAVTRYHVDSEQIFIAGYQNGGTMALRVALRHPEMFTGALSLGGPFPTGLAPLSQLRTARKLPLFITQGRESEFYPPQRFCEELRLFHAAAMHVTLRQYPCADEMTTQMLSDMNAWMMEQVTGVVETSDNGMHAFPNEWN